MKRFTLPPAFVSLLALTGMASAQSPNCGVDEHPIIQEGQCVCRDGVAQ